MISWAAEVDSWKVVDEAGAVVDLEVESGLRAFLGGRWSCCLDVRGGRRDETDQVGRWRSSRICGWILMSLTIGGGLFSVMCPTSMNLIRGIFADGEWWWL